MSTPEEWLIQPDGLADRLRALRAQAGLSGKEFAHAVGWQPPKVSRLENGRQIPSRPDVEAWVRACGGDGETRQAMLDLADEAQTVHRNWKRRLRRGQAAVQASYNQLIQSTSLYRHFGTCYMPGLLQTADYARRVLGEMVELHGIQIHDVDAAVATRMQRQQLLYDSTKRFEFLIAESVLRWMLCPPDVMRWQLDRLQTIVSVPNIRFGVLPFGVPLATAPQNSFVLYDDIAVVETFVGETVHRDEEAAAYARAMDRLWVEAATGDDARELIIQASRALQL